MLHSTPHSLICSYTVLQNSNTREHPNITLGKLIHTNTGYIKLKMSTIKCPNYILWLKMHIDD